MPIVNQEKWDELVRINDDPYGGCCVNVARRVMEILDEDETPLADGYGTDKFAPHALICRADDDTKAGGITGYMAGVAANIVSQVHSRGEEWKAAWNRTHGVEDTRGTVNPALVTINVPDGKTAEEVVTEAAEASGMSVLSEEETLKHFGIEKKKEEEGNGGT